MKNSLGIKDRNFYINSLYLYLSHFADYGMGFIILPFIARMLGPIEIGRIGIAQTFGAFILLLIQFGFSLYAVREVARLRDDKIKSRNFISHIFGFKILLIPFILLISMLLFLFLPIYRDLTFYLCIVLVGSIAQGMIPNWYFEGIEEIKTLSIVKTVFRLCAIIFILILVKNEDDAWMVLFAYSLSSICQFFFLFLKMKRKIGSLKMTLAIPIKQIFKSSKFSFFISAIPTIYQNICLIILSYMVSPVLIGYYFASSKIYLGFNNLFSPLGQAFFPKLSNLEYIDSKLASKEIQKFLPIMFLLGTSFFTVLYFLSDKIVILLLGVEYIPSSNILRAFAFVLPLTAISHVIGRQWLMAKSKDSTYALIQTISSTTGISILLIFINQYKLIAVPFSLIAYEILSITLIAFFLLKQKHA